MKSMDECISDIQQKAEKKIAEQKRRNRILVSTISSFACLVLVMVSVFTIPNLMKGDAPIQPDIEVAESGNATDPIDHTDVGNDPTDNVDDRPVVYGDGGCQVNVSGDSANATCFFLKYGKSICACLNSALENNDDDSVFAIRAIYRPATANITSFTYGGKTLSEIAIAAEDEQSMPEKMAMLLKVGEALKYGEALYTTGTPIGEKWTKEHYDEQIKFFGQDLLDRYIVDGKFLCADLERDMENYNESSAQTEYAQAYNAYLETVYEKATAQLRDADINCEIDPSVQSVIIYATKQQFEALNLDDQGNWYFHLATQEDNKEPTDLVPSDDALIIVN